VLLILAARSDASAAALTRRWHGSGARLLNCEALSRRGWVFDPAAPARGEFVLDGERVQVSSVRGAVSLLSSVHPAELAHIVPEDREYVASEMMAFLVAWLSSLPATVLNRPSPLCLTGPYLRHEQWLGEASRAGLPVRAWTLRVPTPANPADAMGSPPTEKNTTVTVVSGRFVPCPEVPDRVGAAVAAMASSVGAGLLTATFVDSGRCLEFVGAEPTVDVTRDDVADAMLAALEVVP
jgi:hypothetical protein